MSPMAATRTSSVLKITIIAASELWDRIQPDIVALGVRAYTFMTVDGSGEHALLEQGLVTTGDVRVETLVGPALRDAILKHLASGYSGLELVAYADDAEAIARPTEA